MGVFPVRFRISIPVAVMLAFFAAPVAANDCMDCHAGPQGARYGIMSQMTSGSHHVQGVRVTGRHCYPCHWEANPDGSPNERYHGGPGAVNYVAPVDLVIWGNGQRPTLYRPYSSAVTFRPSLLGSEDERREVAQVTSHCLGCHSDRNIYSIPFEGDTHTPAQYAWDRRSIASRYAQKGGVRWGKYSTIAGSGKSRTVKAFSAHGNAAGNSEGWSPATGNARAVDLVRSGNATVNVECFDCHNSHGSGVVGVTTGYRTFGGRFNGGILKETQAGRGGYGMSYTPAGNHDTGAVNPFNAGAALCFDCHESESAGKVPWGYRTTFGATKPVMGYKDTPRFGPGVKESTLRHSLRPRRPAIASSHLKAGRLLNYSTQGEIMGLCTPCHDPHGVSRTLGALMPYAIPLLKGSWLTSPYPDDSPPVASKEPKPGGGMAREALPPSFGLFAVNSERLSGTNYHIDRNTFAGNGRIAEDDSQFAGLCLQCHAKVKLLNDSRTARVHRVVKGWGKNREHAFSCSKCHQPHNSGLPRLMQTNCFSAGPPGLRDSVSVPWFADPANGGSREKSQAKGKGGPGTEAVVGCHIRRSTKVRTEPAGGSEGQWRELNRW